jgi:hypothetical protein
VAGVEAERVQEGEGEGAGRRGEAHPTHHTRFPRHPTKPRPTMKVSATLASLVLLATSAFAAPSVVPPRICGPDNLKPVSVEVEKVIAVKVAEIQQKIKAHKATLAVEKAVTAVTGKKNVQVYWNVIQSGTQVSQGNIPAAAIASQISVLNRDYGSYGFGFTLASTNRVTNAGWFNNACVAAIPNDAHPTTQLTPHLLTTTLASAPVYPRPRLLTFENRSPYSDGQSTQTAMKNSLRTGSAGTLNLYSVGFTNGEASGGLLGYVPFRPSSSLHLAPSLTWPLFLLDTLPSRARTLARRRTTVLSSATQPSRAARLRATTAAAPSLTRSATGSVSTTPSRAAAPARATASRTLLSVSRRVKVARAQQH